MYNFYSNTRHGGTGLSDILFKQCPVNVLGRAGVRERTSEFLEYLGQVKLS